MAKDLGDHQRAECPKSQPPSAGSGRGRAAASPCARSPRKREASGFTQTEVAAAMGTSQSQTARLGSTHIDAKLSTVEKLAAVLGKRVEWRLVGAAR